MDKLRKEILKRLAEKTHKAEQTIKNDISAIHTKSARKATLNACAQIYAQQHDFSVWKLLSKEDKGSLPDIDIQKPKTIRLAPKKPAKKDRVIFAYTSSDHFITEHVKEINRAFNSNCYTSAYILCRKVIENLIIDLLRKQFPTNALQHKELYYDVNNRRFHDFSVVLKNLYDKREEFPVGKNRAIVRLYNLTKNFKDSANDKAHSLYHIVSKSRELDELDLPSILALIVDLERSVGIR